MNLEVVLKSQENWGQAGNGTITVLNVGTTILSNWKFQLTTIDFTIQVPLWEMESSGTGKDLSLSPPSWNTSLPPGQTITSGFSYIGSEKLNATSQTPGVVVKSNQNPPDPNPDPTPDPPFPTPSPTQGRVIGYLTGWKNPPTPEEIANAGYTHILVAFAVFDLENPGALVSAFDTISKDYIASLHQQNIKVLLSIGGSSTSIPNTTVAFGQVLQKAQSFDSFSTNFINSVNQFISDYGFDGLDIDIEQDFNDPTQPQNVGTSFTNPKGDVLVLANILNDLHSQNPNLLISMAPQCANVSPSSSFDQTWDNYSALIMLTRQSLSWVGVQLYNTGGCWGINQQIYAPSENNSNVASSPDFSVALAVDLLENWPSQVGGRPTGWNPYVSGLRPDQVVLGYPCPNAQGQSDGAPYAPPPVIGRAVQCLLTGKAGAGSCDTYIPPKTYSSIGGAFCWEVSYDQANNFAFAKAMSQIFNGSGQVPTPTPVPTPPTPTLTVTLQNETTSSFTIPAGHKIKSGSLEIVNTSSTDYTLNPGQTVVEKFL